MLKRIIAVGLISAMCPLCAHAADSVNIELNGKPLQPEQVHFIDDTETSAVFEALYVETYLDGDTKIISITTAGEPEEASENPAEPTPEPTAEPTGSAAEPADTADETTAYKKMYEGTGYVFERNIPELTCDFEEDACGFEESQHCAWGKDSSGNGVLYVQKETSVGLRDAWPG